MAKESSFDVVSQIDMQEVDNAFQQAKKELSQRYDLKDSGATVALDKQAKKITIKAPSDFVASQVVDVLSSKFVRRKVDLADQMGRCPGFCRSVCYEDGRYRRRYRPRYGWKDQQGHQGPEAQGEGANRRRSSACELRFA